MKRACYMLYNDEEQIQKNCFIAQLHQVMAAKFAITPVSMDQLMTGSYVVPPPGSLVFSVLRQRSWRRLIPFLARYAQHASIVFYDQDPWEAYHDRASSPGIYSDLAALVPVKRFLVTSGFWAEFIRTRDALPVSFVRMGIVAQNCDVGPAFEDRSVEIGFQGTVHTHRAAFFDRLSEHGIHVKCLPGEVHERFLQTVQKIGIFIHDEKADILIDGVLSYNGIWIKDIEVAARGCFAIRNRDLDMASYDIDELPAIFSFDSEDEVPGIIEHIRTLPAAERSRLVKQTVDRIKERNDWMTVVHALEEAADAA